MIVDRCLDRAGPVDPRVLDWTNALGPAAVSFHAPAFVGAGFFAMAADA